MKAAGFLSHYLSGPLSYVRRRITIKHLPVGKAYERRVGGSVSF